MGGQPEYEMGALSNDWTTVERSDEGRHHAGELRRELPDGHVLASENLVAFAVHRRRKKCVFWLPDSQRWAVVHLTWTKEADTRWPSAEVLPTWDSVVAELRDAGEG